MAKLSLKPNQTKLMKLLANPGEGYSTLIEGVDRMILAIEEQKYKVEVESSILKARREQMLELMKALGETKIKVDSGTVTVCAGKRIVKVTDPALSAEIKLIQERGVRTGRCEANIGEEYCMIRRCG